MASFLFPYHSSWYFYFVAENLILRARLCINCRVGCAHLRQLDPALFGGHPSSSRLQRDFAAARGSPPYNYA
jgi:hypothetical protein